MHIISCSQLGTMWSIHQEKRFVSRLFTANPIKLSTNLHVRENIIWMQSYISMQLKKCVNIFWISGVQWSFSNQGFIYNGFELSIVTCYLKVLWDKGEINIRVFLNNKCFFSILLAYVHFRYINMMFCYIRINIKFPL